MKEKSTQHCVEECAACVLRLPADLKFVLHSVLGVEAPTSQSRWCCRVTSGQLTAE